MPTPAAQKLNQVSNHIHYTQGLVSGLQAALESGDVVFADKIRHKVCVELESVDQQVGEVLKELQG